MSDTTQKDGNPIEWLANGETGISSETIWSVMMGIRTKNGPDVPYDGGDFGRCWKLLRVMPSWRERLPEVAAKYPTWTKLVERWDELTASFEAECVRDGGIYRSFFPDTTKLVRECIGL